MKKHKTKKQNGITMIALIITIIIMLILVGVTVSVSLSGGLFKTAKEAVDETEIVQEKEIISRAFIASEIGKGEKEQRFRTSLESEAGAGNVELTTAGEEYEIYFTQKKRYYIVDKKGNIIEYGAVGEISNAGDITKGNTLDGSEEKPYEINCIEDLVMLSYKTNGIKVEEDGTLGTQSTTTYSNKQIILKRNLNFNSKFSYENADRTDYGDLNGNGAVESLMTELTTGKGWIPICQDAARFSGTFDGNGKTIKNLYVNNPEETDRIGLFGYIQTLIIKDLSVTGSINCNSDDCGGIIASTTVGSQVTISNCHFSGTIINSRNNAATRWHFRMHFKHRVI